MNKFLSIVLLTSASAFAQTPQDKAPASGYGIQYLPSKILAAGSDVVTDDALRAQQKQAKFGGLQKVENERKDFDLASNSTFLQIGTDYTLVPKGAVLYVPEKLAGMIVTEPKGKFIPWGEFQQANRGSLARFDVTLEEASGKTPIDPTKLETAKRNGCLMVAVIQGGAISVARP
ncbi:MAG: hypothetical protein QM755_19300 [Luteolibacter sp.]